MIFVLRTSVLGCILLTATLSSPVFGQCDFAKQGAASTDGVCNSNPWVLEFEDNFGGDALDQEVWQIQQHSQGSTQGSANQEYNTLDNASVSDGMLHISIKEETVKRRTVNWHPDDKILDDGLPNLRTFDFTSSSLWTKKIYSYGKFEISCRIPKGKGFWPAFWTYNGGTWNEIDVFEFWDYYNSFGKLKLDKSVRRHRTNTHFDYDNTGGHHNCPEHKYITDFSVGLHVFELEWTPYKIIWKVDGELVRTKYRYKSLLGLKKINCEDYEEGKKYKVDKAFPTGPMHIIVNVAVRRKGVKPNATDTSFPGVMDVDYIRYYKRQ